MIGARDAENQPPQRASINSWTPARCQNLALQDDHGKAFIGMKFDNIGTPSTLTPRRSARIHRIIQYSREYSVSRHKRGSKKMKVKSEKLFSSDTTQKSLDPSENDRGHCGFKEKTIQIVADEVIIVDLPVRSKDKEPILKIKGQKSEKYDDSSESSSQSPITAFNKVFKLEEQEATDVKSNLINLDSVEESSDQAGNDPGQLEFENDINTSGIDELIIIDSPVQSKDKEPTSKIKGQKSKKYDDSSERSSQSPSTAFSKVFKPEEQEATDIKSNLINLDSVEESSGQAGNDPGQLEFKNDINISGIDEIFVLDSPILKLEKQSENKLGVAPNTVVKRPQLSSVNQNVHSSAINLKNRVTPLKSAYAPYFSPKIRNLAASTKSAKKIGSTKATSNVTLRKITIQPEIGSKKREIRRKRSLSDNAENVPAKLKRLAATPKSRLKMPNFKAIHQSQFEKMISIVDHVSQKKDRAIKAFNLTTDVKKLVRTNNTPTKRNIDLSSKKNPSNSAHTSVLGNRNVKARKRIEISKIPIFTKNINDPPLPKVVEFKEASVPCIKREDKVSERRKKNMISYKSGFQPAAKAEIIQGVRSNRRFDLQMVYRNSLK